MDSHKRSIAKTFSWRLVALVITGTVTWILTRELALAVSIGLYDTLVKLGAYYMHERMWIRISFGRTELPEYEI